MHEFPALAKALAKQQKAVIKELVLKILAGLNGRPDIIVKNDVIAEFDRDNSWPTQWDFEIPNAVEYKGVKLSLHMDFDYVAYMNKTALEHYNLNLNKDSKDEDIKETDHVYYGDSYKVTLVFPVVPIPRAKQRSYRQYTPGTWRREIVTEKYWDNEDIVVEATSIVSTQDLVNKLEEAHIDYLKTLDKMLRARIKKAAVDTKKGVTTKAQ
jgi:hypothetical protein